MEWIILATVAAFLLWRAVKRRRGPVSSMRYVQLDGDGHYELEVVGESNYQPALAKIAGGKTEDGHELYCDALLKREPENPHDENAIAVLVKGHKVGYLSRPHARKLSAIFRQQRLEGGYAKAVIVGGWDRGNGDEGHFGVRLDIPVH